MKMTSKYQSPSFCKVVLLAKGVINNKRNNAVTVCVDQYSIQSIVYIQQDDSKNEILVAK